MTTILLHLPVDGSKCLKASQFLTGHRNWLSCSCALINWPSELFVFCADMYNCRHCLPFSVGTILGGFTSCWTCWKSPTLCPELCAKTSSSSRFARIKLGISCSWCLSCCAIARIISGSAGVACVWVFTSGLSLALLSKFLRINGSVLTCTYIKSDLWFLRTSGSSFPALYCP